MAAQSNSGSIHEVNKSIRGANVSDLIKQSQLMMMSGEISTKNPDEYDPNVGASITFTFNEGLIVNIKQNGDIEQ